MGLPSPEVPNVNTPLRSFLTPSPAPFSPNLSRIAVALGFVSFSCFLKLSVTPALATLLLETVFV
jgi:hypothetical protein